MASQRVPNRGRREGNVIGGPRSVAELARFRLRQLIITGALPLGSHLSEQALAEDIGVSRASLREALKTLEWDGLVTHTPRMGTRVVDLTLQDAFEIFTLREHLEDFVLRWGIPAAQHHLGELEHATEQMMQTAKTGDEEHAVLDSLAFQRAFMSLAGNRRVDTAFATIAYPLAVLMHHNREARRSLETLDQKAQRHARLVDLVRVGNVEAVRAELSRHQTTSFLMLDLLADEDASESALAWRDHARLGERP